VVTIGYGIVPDLLVKPARDAQPALVQFERPIANVSNR
jgi:hypothetical protein